MERQKRMKNDISAEKHEEPLPKQSRIAECHLPMAFKISKDQRVLKKRGSYVDSVTAAAVDSLFNKNFEIKGKFSLPEASTLFTETAWRIEELGSLKKELNDVKSRLNDYTLCDWNFHTRRRNKAAEILRRLRDEIKVEYLTQAWCKFYENVCTFPLISEKQLEKGNFNSVHLCEAPGAFIAALNHRLRSKVPDINWNWLATTLNPHYEGHSLTNMVRVDSFIVETSQNWCFGADNTGNLMSLKNLDALVAEAKPDSVNLVTADGSIDCVDTPAEQEQVVSHLHYCETVAAIHLLSKGGNFLLKIFTSFENRTVCLIYLLACCFERIIFNKPVNSREGNSEVYVICLGFVGSDNLLSHVEKLRSNYECLSGNSMFRRNDIPDSFIRQIIHCGEFFKAHQCEAILENIRTFRGGRDKRYVDRDIEKIKRLVAQRFIKAYDLKPLPSKDLTILGCRNIDKDSFTILDFPRPASSYNSRRKEENSSPEQRLIVLACELDFASLPNDGDKFELNVVPQELIISVGKPFERIESTKFCAVRILQMFNEASKLGKKIGFSGEIPTVESIADYKRDNPDIGKILSFDYTSAPDNYRLIKNICDTLTSIENNDNLVLIGYSILSQLNIGILYFLARVFDTVEIQASEKLGCVITLRAYKNIPEVTNIFKEILKASTEAKLNGEVVLSILPIRTLCDSDWYEDIGRMNHKIIKHCILHIISNSEECSKIYSNNLKEINTV